MIFLNEHPIKKKKVREGVYAYLYRDGIEIDGETYLLYSLTEAIKHYRKNHPPNEMPMKKN